MGWLVSEVSPEVTVSIMSQYFPAHRAHRFPLLARKISPEEYAEVTGLVDRLGIDNGWVQEMDLPRTTCPIFPIRTRSRRGLAG